MCQTQDWRIVDIQFIIPNTYQGTENKILKTIHQDIKDILLPSYTSYK